MSERVARAALSRLAEPGDVRLASLVQEHGANTIFAMLREEKDLVGVSTDVATRLRGLAPERDLEEAAAHGIRFVCPEDAEWPGIVDPLRHCAPVQTRGGAPLGLWARGPLSLREATQQAVAVVGSRSATTYGAGVASDIAAHLAGAGVGVVSGAAFGIDQAAHRGALAARGPTVAVLACGVDRAYPSAHRTLLDYIADVGVVVSELPPGCSPTRLRFLSRNRLIAAFARGTVVVEAAVRSGALNTANWTTRLNRVLMGVPGPVTSQPSAGVHELIRAGDAVLVTRGSDVLELVSSAGENVAPLRRAEARPRDRLTLRETQLLDAVPVLRGATAGSIARTAGIGEVEVRANLERLQGTGMVERSGPLWRLVPADDESRPAQRAGS
jgi:DNA processing protein